VKPATKVAFPGALLGSTMAVKVQLMVIGKVLYHLHSYR
jgi:hypothetical protein